MYERDLLLGEYEGINDCPADPLFSGEGVTLSVRKDKERNDAVEIVYIGDRESLFRLIGIVSGNTITLLDEPQTSIANINFRGEFYGRPPISGIGTGTVDGDILTFARLSINIYENDKKVARLRCAFEGARD